jgi:hypothetical protein
MRNVTTEYPLPPLRQEVLLTSAQNDSALTSAFDLDTATRIVHGHVAWAATCRRAVVMQSRSGEVTQALPSRGAAVVAGMGGLGTAVASGALLSHLDDISDQQTCSTDDDGQSSCSSPRGDAAAFGLLLAGTAVALTATSIATLNAKRKVLAAHEVRGDPSAPAVVEADVACGTGAIEGLGVSVYRADERVVASTTDANGDVALQLPAWLSGPITVVADSVPWRYSLVGQNEVLAMIAVAP